MFKMFRLVFSLLNILLFAIIVGMNIMSDFSEQIFITIVIFLSTYIVGRKMSDGEDWQSEMFISCILFVCILLWGVTIVKILLSLGISREIIESIVNYQIITKQALNLTSGILVSCMGYLFGKNLEIVNNPNDNF